MLISAFIDDFIFVHFFISFSFPFGADCSALSSKGGMEDTVVKHLDDGDVGVLDHPVLGLDIGSPQGLELYALGAVVDIGDF